MVKLHLSNRQPDRSMQENRELGISGYLVPLRRRRMLLIGVGLPIFIGAILLAFTLPVTYSSPAVFRFERPAIADFQGIGNHVDNDNYIDQYISKLKDSVFGEASLAAIIKPLGLYPELRDKPQAAVVKFGKDLHLDMIKEKILDPQSGHEKDINSGFQVSYDGKTPEIAQKVSQMLADQFILVGRQIRHDREMATAAFVETEAERYRVQIAGLESKLADFKQQHIGDLPESAQANMSAKDRTEQEMANIGAEIRTLQQNQTFLQAQLQENQANPDTETLRRLEDEYARKKITYDENHPDMVTLRRQIELLKRGGVAQGSSLQSQLETQRQILVETRQRYSDDHPDVRRIQRTISTLEARIAAGEKADQPIAPTNPIVVQLRTQLTGNANQLASLEARKAELREKLNHLQGLLVSSPQVEKDYEVLTRDVTLARQKYDELLKRKMDAEFGAAASFAGRGDEFHFILPPVLPTSPSKPSRSGILVIGAIIAAMFSLGAVFFAEALDPNVRGRRDLADLLAVSPLAVVPEIQNSVSSRLRFRQTATMAVCLLVSVPIMYLIVRLVVQ
jgi:succinoglycan biosynthesis transport protein ExoP